MRVALVALALAACKGDNRHKPSPAPGPKPAVVVDAGMMGSEVKFVGCAAALAPPAVGPSGTSGVPTTPGVKVGAVTVKGGRSNAEIVKALAEHHPRLQFCYEQRLVKQPTLAGSLELAVTVEPDGRVFEVVPNNGFDEELSLCLKHIVSEVTFPASTAKAPARSTVTVPMTFSWHPGPVAPPHPAPKAWTPFAAGQVAPASVADVAAATLPPALTLSKLQACMGTRNGSFRSVMTIGTDGSVTAARTGGLGDKDVEACLSAALVGTKTQPPAAVAEVACDFQRGDATPWRVSLDAGYTVIEPGKTDHTPDPKDAEATFAIVLDPKSTSADIAKALAAAAAGAASIIALRADSGAPLYVAAGPSKISTPDPSTPLRLDTRDPLTICGGLIGEAHSSAFADADKLLGGAARRCTHRPCPAALVIAVDGGRTAMDLAALAGAARGVDFERIGLGNASCPRK